MFISITLSAELKKEINDNTTNRSKFIEHALLEYFARCGIDTKKIKL